MNANVKAVAERYAKDELGREVVVAHVLDHGNEALAYCYATDDRDSFALLLTTRGIDRGLGWVVVEEVDEDDYMRNVERDGIGTSAFFDAVEAAMCTDPVDPPWCPGCGSVDSPCQCPPPQCSDCGVYAEDGSDVELIEEERMHCDPENGPSPSDLYVATVCRDRAACADRVADQADDAAEDRAWRGGR